MLKWKINRKVLGQSKVLLNKTTSFGHCTEILLDVQQTLVTISEHTNRDDHPYHRIPMLIGTDCKKQTKPKTNPKFHLLYRTS